MWLCANKRQIDKKVAQSQNNVASSNKQFFSKIINKHKYKHNQSDSKSLLSIYQTKQNNNSSSLLNNSNIMNLLGVAVQKIIDIQEQFQNQFIYGAPLKILRKGNIKEITAFIDSNLPNMMWFSSLTKTFLFDLAFTSISVSDYHVQRAINSRNYFILSYFSQEIPLIFASEAEKQKYYNLFKYYIIHNKQRQYPPFFSKIMKITLTEELQQNVHRDLTVKEILNISKMLKVHTPEDNYKLLNDIWINDHQKRGKEQRYFNQETQLSNYLVQRYYSIRHCLKNLINVYENYAGVKLKGEIDYLQKTMEIQSFKKFLNKEQLSTQQQIQKLTQFMQDKLNFFDFCAFLQNQKHNYAVLPLQIDENLPLTDYFCFSSHNTYLSGNQLTSDSQIQRYCQDLQAGLKCVEIDIHNDGDVPIITHAFKDKSLCKPIDFQQTIIQIAKFCELMDKNHYPIILSFQNHAKEQNRFKITNILLKYMNKKIYFFSEDYTKETPTLCKTLKELSGKIIMKTDSKYKEIEAFKKKNYSSKNKEPKQNFKITTDIKFPNQAFQERFNKFQETIQRYIKRREQFNFSIPNSIFLPISQMTKITGMFKSQTGVQNQNSMGYQCTSINSQKIQKFKDIIIAYTKRSFLRIYPKSTQILSDNYDPIPCFKIGAQIIALNTQTKDDKVFMMMSYFKAGRTEHPSKIGYIQKPAYLRAVKPEPKPNIFKTITCKIIRDYHNIKMVLYGTSRDMKINEKSQQSFVLYDYDQAFIMFYIDQQFRECIPVRFIRSGYRVLVAKNSYFKDSGIRVIVKISITNNNIN